MTHFEQVVEEDKEVKQIRKTRDLKLQTLEFNNNKQKDRLRKGKPLPALSMGKQFQNTRKDVDKQHDRSKALALEITLQADKEIRRRKEELSRMDEYKEVYKQHLIEKRMERMKENQQSLNKDRDHGR